MGTERFRAKLNLAPALDVAGDTNRLKAATLQHSRDVLDLFSVAVVGVILNGDKGFQSASHLATRQRKNKR